MADLLETDDWSNTNAESGSDTSIWPATFIPSKRGRNWEPKTYQCPVEGCKKVYSRAEHLSRHQLNHNPKEIFRCDVPRCTRSFVRVDLYHQHHTRHMSEYLQKHGNRALRVQNDSTPSPKLAEDGEESEVFYSSQFPNPPPYTTDVESSSPQNTQLHRAKASTVRKRDDEIHVISSGIHQNNTNAQDEQYYVELQRNKVPIPTEMPVSTFGGDGNPHLPFTAPDDIIQYLFSGTDFDNTINNDNWFLNNFPVSSSVQAELAKGMNEGIFNETYFPQMIFAPSEVQCEINVPSKEISDDKSQEIFELIRDRLISNKNTPVSNHNSSLLNIMSKEMMQSHIDAYWQKFHPQLPILHRPTFCSNKTPNLLLIAIMILGLSCGIKSNDETMIDAATEFLTILAWHLRWEIFSSMQIQSDDLWVFQALLLLEIYEKTYASRALHERAHVHHATTITLMRRGSFLVGRSPLDSPQGSQENYSGAGNMTRSFCKMWWDEWIRREATRRVAFAAFMIDSTHAAMFGHSMSMASHEMRLTLPCDEALWEATNTDEVWKIESTLRSNGIRSLSFLECLRRTLNGREIYTNAFARSILLSGLLSISWHMNQRDLQLTSLDVGSHGAKWRRSITRAFDMWNAAYEQAAETMSDGEFGCLKREDAVSRSSRTALYHLAHFSMHVDIVECQIFAGAGRVLGRSIGKQDGENARYNIRNNWAPSKEARQATLCALRFLCSVFQNGDQVCDHDFVVGYATSKTMPPMHRWVLYSAALVIWSYSYAIDGPVLHARPASSSIDDHIQDFKNFLTRVNNIKSLEDVAYHRFNSCAGMLRVLAYIFRMGTWELLHEGADLLLNCISLIERRGER